MPFDAAVPPALLDGYPIQVSHAHRQPHGERRALSELALDGEIATEQARQSARDGEPESGSTLHGVTARSGVQLIELVEDALLIPRRDADTRIDDLHGHPRLADVRRSRGEGRILRRSARHTPRYAVHQSSAHGDAPGWRVFDGVADEIHENLSQMTRIGTHAWKCRTDGNRQRELALR